MGFLFPFDVESLGFFALYYSPPLPPPAPRVCLYLDVLVARAGRFVGRQLRGGAGRGAFTRVGCFRPRLLVWSARVRPRASDNVRGLRRAVLRDVPRHHPQGGRVRQANADLQALPLPQPFELARGWVWARRHCGRPQGLLRAMRGVDAGYHRGLTTKKNKIEWSAFCFFTKSHVCVPS